MSEDPRTDLAHFLGPGETTARADPPARISLTGELDPSAAAAVAIELMAHDGHSDEEVQLLIRSGDGTVAAALLLMDTIDAMGVPVLDIGPGEVGRPALGVVAVCHRRTVWRNSRIFLSAPSVQAQGTAEDLAEAVRRAQLDLARFVARATRQQLENIEIDLRQGRQVDAEEAITYRPIDGIWTRR